MQLEMALLHSRLGGLCCYKTREDLLLWVKHELVPH